MAVILGNDKPNTLNGTENNDKIEAFGADDFASGKAGDDNIFGGTGNDILEGNGDNDRIDGGAGYDKMFGGAGIDWADYSEAANGVDLSLQQQIAWNDGFGNSDELYQFENVVGSVHDDYIYGNDGANVIDGNNGDDELLGGYGQDTIYGGKDSDLIFGGYGGDALFGEKNDDEIFGGYGADFIDGGKGDDYLSGDDSDDIILGGAKGFDQLFGGEGNDILDGGNKADLLVGGEDNDVFQGGVEDKANDQMYSDAGGFDEDLFIISRQSGSDVIWDADFEGGARDRVDLTALGDIFDSFADVQGLMTQVDVDTIILTLDPGNSLTFHGFDGELSINDFQADDFILAP